ncbi:MAG: hypothetical protein HUJ69_00560 [Lachnospiraceae bacterium]|nr:hypothetical protein [Lachnospiraceae bacterium]
MYRRDCLECGAWTKRWAVTELREFWWVSWTDETGNPVTEAYSSEEEQLMRVDALGQQQISASYGNGYETVILDWIYSESTE